MAAAEVNPMASKARRGKDLPVETAVGDAANVSVCWGFRSGAPSVAVDCTAVFFSGAGEMLDAVYYNNLNAFNRAAIYGTDAEAAKDDDSSGHFTLKLAELPSVIKVAVIVATVAEGTLQDMDSASLALSSTFKGSRQASADYAVSVSGLTDDTVIIFGALFRPSRDAPGRWMYRHAGMPAQGRDFQACMKPMRSFADTMLGEETGEEVTLSRAEALNLRRGETAYLPDSETVLSVGLGWHCQRNLDVDAACVLLGPTVASNDRREVLEVVYYGHQATLRYPGLARHASDGLAAGTEGDEETIFVDLAGAPRAVQEIVVAVNIYAGGSMADCSDCYVRLMAGRGNVEIARYEVDQRMRSEGCVFAKVYRDGARWAFKALGDECRGRRAVDDETILSCGGEPVGDPNAASIAVVTGEGECCTMM